LQPNLIEQFIQERKYFKNVTPKTVAAYRQSFHAFEGAMDSKATVGERIAKLRDRGVSAISVNSYLRSVNALFRWGHTEGHIPGELIRVPKLKEEQKVLPILSPDQIHRVIGFKPRREVECQIHTLACLLLDTGLRIDEALSLTHDDVDLDNLLIRVQQGKGQKQRIVPMSSEMRKLLWKWLRQRNDAAAALVFATRDGKKLQQRNLLRVFKRFGNRLKITGVRFSFHTFRHTFATNYIRRGGDVFRLQRVLGHSSLEMSRKYVNLQTGDLLSVHERLSVVGNRVA
jgi:integrase/recombinase XerD